MSTAKHAPGPWNAFNASWSETFITAPGFDHGICCLDINHATEESQDADEAQMAANARLIAAAPELLEALQFVMSAHGEQLTTAFEQAQAAIAKATGEQS